MGPRGSRVKLHPSCWPCPPLGQNGSSRGPEPDQDLPGLGSLRQHTSMVADKWLYCTLDDRRSGRLMGVSGTAAARWGLKMRAACPGMGGAWCGCKAGVEGRASKLKRFAQPWYMALILNGHPALASHVHRNKSVGQQGGDQAHLEHEHQHKLNTPQTTQHARQQDVLLLTP